MRRVCAGLLLALAPGAGHSVAADAASGGGVGVPPPALTYVRVGEPDGEIGGSRPGPKALPATRALDCERATMLVERLGESYAGFRLRTTLLERACPPDVAERARRAVWSWPWERQRPAMGPPQSLVAEAGDWQVRCASHDGIRRCALFAKPHPGAEAGSHFVLSRIAGVDGLLWRVRLGRDAKPEHMPSGEPGGVIAPGASPRLAFESIGGGVHETFTHCDAASCLFEATLGQASDVAGLLAAGRDIRIDISRPGDAKPAVPLVLEARGFREGLRELARLRRDERKGR